MKMTTSYHQNIGNWWNRRKMTPYKIKDMSRGFRKYKIKGEIKNERNDIRGANNKNGRNNEK